MVTTQVKRYIRSLNIDPDHGVDISLQPDLVSEQNSRGPRIYDFRLLIFSDDPKLERDYELEKHPLIASVICPERLGSYPRDPDNDRTYNQVIEILNGQNIPGNFILRPFIHTAPMELFNIETRMSTRSACYILSGIV